MRDAGAVMSDHLVIVAPDEEHWEGMASLFATSAIDLILIRKLDAFAEHHLDPTNTIVLVDADQNADRLANFMSGLVRHRFVGVVTVSRELSPSERVMLMYMGADHCLVRPVAGEELAVIASNMFRHARLRTATSRLDEPAPWKLDLQQWRLTTPRGHDIALSAGEMSLLATLFSEPGKMHLRTELRAPSVNTLADASGRSLDVQISRLRRKVEIASSMTLPVRSSRGAGYVFASPATIIPADAVRN